MDHIKHLEETCDKYLDEAKFFKPEGMTNEQWEKEKPERLNDFIDKAKEKIKKIEGITLEMLRGKPEAFGLRTQFTETLAKKISEFRKKFE